MNEAECVPAIARPMSAFRDLATTVLNFAYVYVPFRVISSHFLALRHFTRASLQTHADGV